MERKETGSGLTLGAGSAENVPLPAAVNGTRKLPLPLANEGITEENERANASVSGVEPKLMNAELKVTSVRGGVESPKLAEVPLLVPEIVAEVLNVPDSKLFSPLTVVLSRILKVPAKPVSEIFPPLMVSVVEDVASIVSVATTKPCSATGSVPFMF